jgi:hypothetical protein
VHDSVRPTPLSAARVSRQRSWFLVLVAAIATMFATLVPAGQGQAQTGVPSAPGIINYYSDTGGVAWSSPDSSGTASLTGYELYANDGLVVAGVVWSATVPAPTSGTLTLKVRACNSNGCGPYATTAYTAPGGGTGGGGGNSGGAGVPSAPGIINYYPSSGAVAWSSPDSSGTSSITGYELYANDALITSGVTWSATYPAPTSGTLTLKVRACNASGCGAFASTTYTAPGGTGGGTGGGGGGVLSGAPSAPGIINYYPASGAVAWSSPDSAGATGITGYELYANDALITSGVTWSATYPAPTSGTVTLKVRACNTIGCGPFAMTTYTGAGGGSGGGAAGAPSAPGVLNYYADSGAVAWSSPDSVGASSITKYELYANEALVVSGVVWSATVAAPTSGTLNLKVRACNSNGCGPYATKTYNAPGGGGSGGPQGIIVPAYYSLDETAKWSQLAAAAGQLSPQEFWVTANNNNGPFSAGQWPAAQARFGAIENNGGRIAGYVYTHQAAYQSNGTLAQQAAFRDLASVQANITAWVNGYPGLDAIWLDEFYPRHELATESGPGYDGRNANFPNGLGAAPTGYRTPGLDLWATGQIDPTGGWYDVLIKWIRATYPNLKIIGNAGGQLYSNQMRYGALVDILVSFEQTQQTASANNWSALRRNDPEYATSPQLALVHNVPDIAAMQTVVTQSKAAGFQYIYATNGTYNGALWFDNPPYLSELVTAAKGSTSNPPSTNPPGTNPPGTNPPGTNPPTTIAPPDGAHLLIDGVVTLIESSVDLQCIATSDGATIFMAPKDDTRCVQFLPSLVAGGFKLEAIAPTAGPCLGRSGTVILLQLCDAAVSWRDVVTSQSDLPFGLVPNAGSSPALSTCVRRDGQSVFLDERCASFDAASFWYDKGPSAPPVEIPIFSPTKTNPGPGPMPGGTVARAVLQAWLNQGLQNPGWTLLNANPDLKQIIEPSAKRTKQQTSTDDCSGIPQPPIEAAYAGLESLLSMFGGQASTVGIMVACVDRKFYVRVSANGCDPAQKYGHPALEGTSEAFQKTLFANVCHTESNLLSEVVATTTAVSTGWVTVAVMNSLGQICSYCMFQNLPAFGSGRPGIRLGVGASDTDRGVGFSIDLAEKDAFRAEKGKCQIKNETHPEWTTFKVGAGLSKPFVCSLVTDGTRVRKTTLRSGWA